ncbi:MAG: HAD family phosphatase [Rikenellaceae bacterium]
MTIKGVIFDMDGVLVDNMWMHILVFEKFLLRWGITDLKAKLTSLAGMGNDEIMIELLPEEVIEKVGLKQLGVDKEALYREMYAESIEPVEGLVDFLKELKANGVKCAIGSSGCRENVEFVINSCGIAEYFDALVYSDLVTNCKPDPEIYLKAMEMLGISGDEAVVFEDAKAGILAARRAGVTKVIGVATTLSRDTLESETDADLVIDNFTQNLFKFFCLKIV